jgi:Tfp pilus assembly protein PilF
MTQRPDDPKLHAELGEMLLQVGQEAAGEAQLLIALQLDPNLLAAHEVLARWYDQHGQPDLAQQYRLAAQRLAASDKTEEN